MGRLAGRKAIVTGAARGIGKAIIERFRAEGAAVLATDVLAEEGEATATACGAIFAEQDVRDPARWAEIGALATEQLGGLDILVNNAGVIGGGPIEACPLENWERVIGINLTGTFLGCQMAVNRMKETGGGAIVNVSSINGYVGIPGDAAYTASKGGVRLLTKSVAVRCAREGWNIRCNSLHPGAIETSILEPAYQAAPIPRDQLKAVFAGMSPMDRMGQPEEMAAAIVFLASDDASFMTGAELLVDGGALAATPGL